MAAGGLIHGKFDLKLLILFILKGLPGPVDINALFNICFSDEGVGYFDFSECLNELQLSGHINETDEGISINQNGIRIIDELETNLPFSVRSKVSKLIANEAEKIHRASLIRVSHEVTDGGCFEVRLSLSDGKGMLLNMQLLCPDVESAKKIESNFKKNPEIYYSDFVSALSEGRRL